MDQSPDQATYFLPAEALPLLEVEALRERVLAWPPLRDAIDNCPEGILLLNEHRQIVYANPAFLRYSGGDAPLTGRRFGDVMSCIHLDRTPGGCGTGYACRNCQIANGIFSALRWTGSQFHGLIHVATEGPREIPVRARLESVIVGDQRLLFCRIAAHAGHPMPVGDASAAPPELQDLCNLMASGGPFCPY